MPGRFREIVTAADPVHYGTSRTMYNGVAIGSFQYDTTQPQFARRCWDATHPGPPYVETGPFHLLKSGYPFDYVQGKGKYIGTDYRPSLNLFTDYTGGFIPNGFGPSTIDSSVMKNVGKDGNPYDRTFGRAEEKSAEAYNRFKPKLNKANLGQTIGEFRDFVPMLKTSASGFHDIWKELGGHATEFGPKTAAEHFINHQFGWLPFLNDMSQGYDTYQNTARYVRNLRKHNNEWVKRGGTLTTDSTLSDVVVTRDLAGGVLPSLPTAFYSDAAIASGERVESQYYTGSFDKVWFEGRFRYYIPSLGLEDNNYHKIMNRIQLYGLRVSPTLLWKITPWTWLADWYSNAGDVISNAEDNYYGLASLYACTMRNKGTHVVNNSTIYLKDGPVQCTWSQEIESKSRWGGEPFGLGFDWDHWDAGQIAILGSLGITRM